MEKFKICPVCGSQNASTLLECLFCETDLTGIRIQEPETQACTAPDSADAADAPVEMVRICEACGAVNQIADRKCTDCGEDISDITPTAQTAPEAEPMPTYILSSVDGSYDYRLSQPQTLIGRACEMQEYLGAKAFVSRTHARIDLEDGRLYISNLSGTNHTFVNDNRITTDRYPLQDGDEIGLGGCRIHGARQEKAAYFVVRTGSCT